EEVLFAGGVGAPQSAQFTPDGKTLSLTGAAKGAAFSAFSVEELRKEKGEVKPQRAGVLPKTSGPLAVAPSGKVGATMSNNSTVGEADLVLWDLTHKEPQDQDALKVKERGPYEMAFSPDSRLLATGSPETVIVWDVASGKRKQTFNIEDNTTNTGHLAF